MLGYYFEKFFTIYARRFFIRPVCPIPSTPSLSIETTNICNSRCIFCANLVMRREKKSLSLEAFKRSVDEYAAMGGEEIDFNVTIGDPLLDKYLLDRVRYVRRRYRQIKTVGFITSLQWLHRYDLEEFFNSGLTWISVSTVLSGRDRYRDFFGVDKYYQMLANLKMLLIENRRKNTPLIVWIAIKPTPEPAKIIMKHPDYQEIKLLSRLDLDTQIRKRHFYVDDWIGAIKLPRYLKKRPLYYRRKRPCRILYKGLMIFSNGNIGACSCRDFEADSDLILGNIESDSLQGTWKSERLASIRSDWLNDNKIPHICRSCRHYLY